MIDDSILEYKRTGTYKGSNGKALVVAGSKEYAGAATLTAQACEAILRTGADLTVACAPEQIAWLVNHKLPEAITTKYNSPHFTTKHVNSVLQRANDADVVLIGPGLGDEAQRFAHDVIANLATPAVIDADAINAITLDTVTNAIITPHAHEYEQLLERSQVSENAIRSALSDETVILKKGTTDTILTNNRKEENTTGNAGMTKGGTGDILAGFTAGFVAQGRDLFKAACAAAYLNGAIADVLYEERGTTYIPSDILDNVHTVLN